MIGVGEVVIIAVVLLFLMLGAAAVVVLVVLMLRSKPNRLEGTQALPGVAPVAFPPAGALPPAGAFASAGALPPAHGHRGAPSPATGATQERRRTIAADDYTFDKLTRSMQQIGFEPQGVSRMEVAPGEPGSAVFVSGALTASYQFDAETGLRMIDIVGPNAKMAMNDLLNEAYLPTIEGYKVSGLLGAADARTLLKAIRAAEFISINGDEKYYIDPVGKLTSHPDPSVASEARRVHQVLASKQVGG